MLTAQTVGRQNFVPLSKATDLISAAQSAESALNAALENQRSARARAGRALPNGNIARAVRDQAHHRVRVAQAAHESAQRRLKAAGLTGVKLPSQHVMTAV